MRGRTRVLVALMVLGVSACAVDGSTGPASSELQQTRRGPVSLEGWEADLVSPAELSLSVPSCGGVPELAQLIEDPDVVRLEVVTTVVISGDTDACLDGLAVVLEAPLGDREVIDLTSGTAVTVVDQTAVLECFDADYPIEPTFETPEEALADVLQEQPSFGTVPDRVEDYVRTDRDGGVYFEHLEDHHVVYTWGLQQDGDGRWGVVSLGGCF